MNLLLRPLEDVNDVITLLFTSNGWLSTANQGNPVIA